MLDRSKVAPWIKDVDHWVAMKKEHPEGFYVLAGRDENGDLISEALLSLNSKRKEDFIIESINFLYGSPTDGKADSAKKNRKSGHLGVKRHPGHKIAEDYFSSRCAQD